MKTMLQAMVEAMIAELKTQSAFILDEDGPTDVLIDGHVDLEAVARAALRAIRDPTKGQAIAGQDALDDSMDSDWSSDIDGNRETYMTVSANAPANVYRAMIDALLKAESGTAFPENPPKTQNGPQPGAVK